MDSIAEGRGRGWQASDFETMGHGLFLPITVRLSEEPRRGITVTIYVGRKGDGRERSRRDGARGRVVQRIRRDREHR